MQKAIIWSGLVMELNALSPFVALLSFVLFLLILVKSKKNSKSTEIYSHIPGPKKLPLIGNLHLMLRGGAAPHRLFRDLAVKHGPLMHLKLGELDFLVASSVDFAREVFRTHDVNFANRPPGLLQDAMSYNYSDLVVAAYGDSWRHLRRICTKELLSNRRVLSFRGVREEEAANLARWIASNEGSPLNLSERLYRSSYDVLTRTTVGAKIEDRGEVISVIQEATNLASGFILADLYPSVKMLPAVTGVRWKIRRMRRKMDQVIDRIIEQHKAAEKDEGTLGDLVDVLLNIQQRGSDEMVLTTDNIKALLMDLFVAGTDTSTITTEWAMTEMMRNPNILKRAQDEVRKVFDGEGRVNEQVFSELKYLNLVIKETLRMHVPAPFLIPRISNERCEINGYEIPAGSRVIVNAWALGRDPTLWNDPEKFVPERFEESSIDFKGNNLEFIPFGAGRRLCPGISFAMANVESTLAMLLYHFDWENPNSEDLDMDEVFGATVKKKRPLHLVPTVKRPLPAKA